MLSLGASDLTNQNHVLAALLSGQNMGRFSFLAPASKEDRVVCL